MCTAAMSDRNIIHQIAKGKKVSVKKGQIKLKKAPGAPRRFKSAFIFFSTEKHKEIRSGLGEEGNKTKTTNVAKMVSKAWKDLSPEEREHWDKKARVDKERYELERVLYDGPWKVPAQKPGKDPSAPKRPMSAFLSYSNTNRSKVKSNNPSLSNAEISRVLASMWRDMDDGEKQHYIDEEVQLRSEYKSRIAEWRANEEIELEFERKRREEMAVRTLESQKRQLVDEKLYNAIRRNSMVQSSQYFSPPASHSENMNDQHTLPSHYFDNRSNIKNNDMNFWGSSNGDNNNMYFQHPYHEMHQQYQLPFHPSMNGSYSGPTFEGGVTDSAYCLEPSSTYNSSDIAPFNHEPARVFATNALQYSQLSSPWGYNTSPLTAVRNTIRDSEYQNSFCTHPNNFSTQMTYSQNPVLSQHSEINQEGSQNDDPNYYFHSSIGY